jgi:magnesium chelatase family protein
MLVARMNPCVCDFLTDSQKECNCTPLQIQRYRSRVSGHLLDRIDIQLEVPARRSQDLASKTPVIHPRSIGSELMRPEWYNKLGLSVRAYGRVLKVARTIADLAGSSDIDPRTLAKRFSTGAWIEGCNRVESVAIDTETVSPKTLMEITR